MVDINFVKEYIRSKINNSKMGCTKCNFKGYSIIDGQVISCVFCKESVISG